MTIQVALFFRINQGKVEEFKRLVADCAESARRRGATPMRYEIFLNVDESGCTIHEEYVDAASYLQNVGSLRDKMAAILELAEMQGQLWGDVLLEQRRLAEDLGLQVFVPLRG